MSDFMLNFQSTQLSCFYECPRKWYYNYLLRRSVPPNDAMERGSAFHKLCEYYYGMNIRLEDIKEYMLENDPKYMRFFPEIITAFLCYVEEEKSSGYEFITIDGKPAVEVEFNLVLADWFIYRGKLDSIRRRENSDGIYIVDWKVTRAYLNDYFFAKFEMSPQAMSYSFVGKEYFNSIPDLGDLKGFVIDGVMIKDGKYNFQKRFFPVLPNLDEFVTELRGIGNFIKANHENEEAFEHRYTSCINRYNKKCDYYDVCRSSKGVRHKLLQSDLFIDYQSIYNEELA